MVHMDPNPKTKKRKNKLFKSVWVVSNHKFLGFLLEIWEMGIILSYHQYLHLKSLGIKNKRQKKNPLILFISNCSFAKVVSRTTIGKLLRGQCFSLIFFKFSITILIVYLLICSVANDGIFFLRFKYEMGI